jgi:phage terminase large subunit GpA-like protein
VFPSTQATFAAQLPDNFSLPPALPAIPADSFTIRPESYSSLISNLQHEVAQSFIPPRRDSLSVWAEKNIVLSSEYAARASELRLFSWQKEIFDAFTDPYVEEITLMCSTQLVKCLALDTPLPTPNGWTEMGEVERGDILFDQDGKPCRVTAVSPVYSNRQCYRLTFDDGTSIVSDDGHYWVVFDRNGQYNLVTTQQMYEGIRDWSGKTITSSVNRFRISCAKPLQLPEIELPIEPYTFGCWLGDGESGAGYITVDTRDGIIAELEKAGTVCEIVALDSRRPHVAKLRIGARLGWKHAREHGFKATLRSIGVLNNKHIPEIYLRASYEQRLALLQGIMDTDGSVNLNSTIATLIQKNINLASDCRELARSLGFKPTLREGRASLNGKDAGLVAKLYFAAYAEERPFRLKRKAERLRSVNDSRVRKTEARRRSILSIVPVESVPVRCVAVDSTSRLYLAGHAMIPTHNTLLIQAALAFIIKEDPGPVLILQPKDQDAKAFSKERLGPMLRDCVALRGLVSESAHDGNTILMKEFPGGSVALAGAISAGNMARRSIRYLLCDEIDKYPLSAGKEGDPVMLAVERTATFGSRKKIIKCCSPTVDGISRIDLSYKDSDMRKPYVPCPYCGHLQILSWSKGVQFDPLGYICASPSCRKLWTELDRRRAVDHHVIWRAERPFTGHAGFWINHLYSPFKHLRELVKMFKKANRFHNKEALKVFVNTNLAETWKETGQSPNDNEVYERREFYSHGEEILVPRRALFLTAAVDVQENPARLEVEVIGWGRERENWSLMYKVIQKYADGDAGLGFNQGDSAALLPVTHKALWDALNLEVLQRQFVHESGHLMPIMVMCIDTGSRSQPVIDFARKHARLGDSAAGGVRVIAPQTVVPTKGNDDAFQIISAVSSDEAARKRMGVKIVMIGTHRAKQDIFDSLLIAPNAEGPTPGCYHHPDYTKEYFEGLAGETKVVHDNGKVEYVKKPNVRNEPLDLKVMNRAAASIYGIDRFKEKTWQKFEEAFATQPRLSVDVDETIGQEVGQEAGQGVDLVDGVGVGVGVGSTQQAKPAILLTAPSLAIAPRAQIQHPPQPVRRVRGKFKI